MSMPLYHPKKIMCHIHPDSRSVTLFWLSEDQILSQGWPIHFLVPYKSTSTSIYCAIWLKRTFLRHGSTFSFFVCFHFSHNWNWVWAQNPIEDYIKKTKKWRMQWLVVNISRLYDNFKMKYYCNSSVSANCFDLRVFLIILLRNSFRSVEVKKTGRSVMTDTSTNLCLKLNGKRKNLPLQHFFWYNFVQRQYKSI